MKIICNDEKILEESIETLKNNSIYFEKLLGNNMQESKDNQVKILSKCATK